MRRHHFLIAALLLIGLWGWTQRSHDGSLHAPPTSASSAEARAGRDLDAPPATPDRPFNDTATRYPAFLPREARAVLDSIVRGGPYDYRQDGTVFQNRERLLPPRPRGHYREFTVPTPGAGDRGPRRIVTGGDPPREYWYSADHYRSFRRFEPGNGASR